VIAKIELLVLTLVSLLANTAALRAAYRARGGEWLHLLDESRWGALLRELGAFVVMVGIPFVALILGAVDVHVMGLGADLMDPDALAGFTFANWMRGVGMAFCVVAVLLLTLWLGARAAPHGQPWQPGWLAVRDALYNEVHWAFYRAAPALLLMDAYWGVVIGAVLVLAEWFISPAFEVPPRSVEGRQYLTLRLGCLFASGFLYLATHNLWLMIVADLVIQLAGSRLLSGRGGRDLDAQGTSVG
jgi:hypothetical protein